MWYTRYSVLYVLFFVLSQALIIFLLRQRAIQVRDLHMSLFGSSSQKATGTCSQMSAHYFKELISLRHHRMLRAIYER
jgi:hypothetical protein